LSTERDDTFNKRTVPMMPDALKGDFISKGDFTNTTPRRWTQKELDWAINLKSQGFSVAEIAESVCRSEISVQIKLKRITKSDDSYNKRHILEKYEANRDFLEYLEPETVLDVFCGQKSFYKANELEFYLDVTTNDKDENIEADFHLDALKFLCLQYYKGNKFDLIDLDPFGSAAECFDLAIHMARKGLVITLGEIGHKRWKRLDYVSRHYEINSLEDFTTINLIECIKKQALKHKKILKVWQYREWQNISRVWFEIEPLKITEQWDKERAI
jgi:hypothetical protein